jgi:Glyoxalase-like domain
MWKRGLRARANAPVDRQSPMTAEVVLLRVDHLVYACAELEQGVAEIEQVLGVRASLGGRHPMWGTHNALVGLGARSYLEIIAPDPDYTPTSGQRPFGLDAVSSSRLVAWAASGRELQTWWNQAVLGGVHLGAIQSGSRRRADGVLLEWTLTDLRCVVGDGVVPFLIDWGTSPHPSLTAPKGALLAGLRAQHPDNERVRNMLSVLALDLNVDAGLRPALIAEIRCPNGVIVLR